MGKAIDLVGQRFGRLLVIERTKNNKYGQAQWICKCDCNSQTIVVGNCLRSGHTKSCGCLSKDITKERSLIHGQASRKTKTRTYRIWTAMITRCSNPKQPGYKLYGGRGITVCNRWKESFENFYEDMGDCPSNQHSLDRKDNEGNYTPKNCRWATAKEQSHNSRKVKIIEFGGDALPLIEWAKKLNIKESSIRNRLNKGMSIEDAFKKVNYKHRNQPIKDFADA